MRFQHSAVETDSEPTHGGRWRPPDHVSTPNQLFQDFIGKKGEGDDQKCEESKRLAREEQRAKRKRREKQKAKPRQQIPQRPEWIRKIVGEGLPFPSTQTQASRPRHRLTYCQRVFAISIAILVVLSLLGSLVTILSEQLERVASKVEAQNEMMQTSGRIQLKGDRHLQSESREPRRKLAMISSSGISPSPRLKDDDRFGIGFLSNMYRSALAAERLISALRKTQQGPFSAYLLQQPGYTPILIPTGYSVKTMQNHLDATAKLNSIQRELRSIYHDLVMGKVNAPLQLPKSESVAPVSSFPSLPNRIVHPDYENPRRAESLRSTVPDDIMSQKKKRNNHHVDNSRHILHSNALNVVGDIGNAEPSQNDDNRGRSDIRFEAHNSNKRKSSLPKSERYLSVNGNLTSPGSNYGYEMVPFPDAIEVWSLPNGRSLCRVFGAGRLPEGTLVLPKWMKSEFQFLNTRCGIRGAIYAIERMDVSGRKAARADRRILEATIKSDFEEDRRYTDRDVFGMAAPRNHMPHFVSDIFLPLVASEILLGSGKRVQKSSFVSPETALKSTELSGSMFPDPKPALLIYDETWNRPSTEWVPRLARFFQHPRLDFEMIPTGAEKEAKQGLHRTAKLTYFRSIVTSNLNIHEPYGLFGANGKNVVFAVNGITRDPPWKMKGIQDNPCVIHVTVLTRKGPRALLKLKELEKRVISLGTAKSMNTKVQVADFADIPFDEQIRIMQSTNVLVATHGAGNANFIFMRPQAAVIEVFPFSYKAGPFDSFARIFGLHYRPAMSAPQTDVFKECMNRHEKNARIKKLAFSRWDKAVAQEKKEPWVHRLDFEKEFGEPGKSQGMTTRGCVRLQELEFSVEAVARMVVDSGRTQCSAGKHM